MIKNFKQFNEGINHLLVGPTRKELWDNHYKEKLEGLIDYLPDTPEEFFEKIKEGIYYYPNHSVSGVSGYWLKNGSILFSVDYEKDWLLIDTRYIWYTLERLYGLKEDEIRILIRNSFKDSSWGKLHPVTAGFTERKFK